MSLRGKLPYENKFDLHENEPVGQTHFHLNGFDRTKIRFDTETRQLGMAYNKQLLYIRSDIGELHLDHVMVLSY